MKLFAADLMYKQKLLKVVLESCCEASSVDLSVQTVFQMCEVHLQAVQSQLLHLHLGIRPTQLSKSTAAERPQFSVEIGGRNQGLVDRCAATNYTKVLLDHRP